MNKPFWETKSLKEMSDEEWESLCDHCGWCCLHKYEDEDSGEIKYSNVACKLLQIEDCSCTQYDKRERLVESCTKLTPQKTDEFHWLPESCAYRLIQNGTPLANWHPLISGNYEKMNADGINIRSFAISENDVDMADVENEVTE